MRFVKILLVCLGLVSLAGISAEHGSVVGGTAKLLQKPFIVVDRGDSLSQSSLVADGSEPFPTPPSFADGSEPFPTSPSSADGSEPFPTKRPEPSLGPLVAA
jgi:hypothetical protein